MRYHRPHHRSRRAAAFLILAFAAVVAAGAVHGQAEDPLLWPEPQRAFLQDGPGMLLKPEQRQELLSLNERGREQLIQAFLRDPLPETPVNELVVGIERRQRLAALELGSPTDVRSQLLFLHGKPEERLVLDCGTAFEPLEIWVYPEGRDEGGEPFKRQLVVYRPGAGEPWRLWVPMDSKRALYASEMEYWLEQWEELGSRLRSGRGGGRARRFDIQVCKEARRVDDATGVEGLNGFREERPKAADYERYLAPPDDLARWAAAAAATQVPDPPPPLGVGGLDVSFPDKRGQRIVARAFLTLPPDSGVKPVTEGDKTELKLLVEGTVEQGNRVFDEFRVRYRLEPPADGVPIALALDRSLRPAQSFLLRLKVRDEVSGAEARVAGGFAVPREPQAAPEVPVPDDVVVALGEDLALGRIAGRDSLVMVPPEEDVVLGLWRAEALVTGNRIVKVVFLVDGQQQLARSKPPFSAEVRLTELPTEQVVRVEGYDAEGQLVAADDVVVNQQRGSLRVRVVEPRRGAKITGGTRARAEVVVPEERRVEQVEFRVNDQVVATLTSPPWQAQVEVPKGEDVVYLTVAAVLDDGSRAEDVRFLNAPEYLEEVEVNLVEMYATVTDRGGKLVRDLKVEELEVVEAGRPQQITKFELVEDLPLTVGVTIDTSGSMSSSLAEAQRAAADFLENVVRRGDKSFSVAFSDRPVLLMPPTDDVGAVTKSLEGLQAVGYTSLHDAVVTSLYYFRGMRGQRALVLLSDGDDTSSHIAFREALEYARRSGVAIFTIGLNVSTMGIDIRRKLGGLADETGGRSFFIGKAEELAGVYDEIEAELRSRYLLTFTSDRPAGDESFRPVEVKVKRRGLKVRSARGYYQ